MFLVDMHIPEEVLRQSEHMLSTTIGRALRPILTHMLGQYFVPKEASAEISVLKSQAGSLLFIAEWDVLRALPVSSVASFLR